MNQRLHHQLEAVRRVLPMLSDTRTPVLEVRLNAESAHPTLYTGIGPYDWAAVSRGQDGDGPYTDYVARLRGVELHHRLRPRVTRKIAR